MASTKRIFPLDTLGNQLQGGAVNDTFWWPNSITENYNEMRLGNSQKISDYRDKILRISKEVICTNNAILFGFFKYDANVKLIGASCVAIISQTRDVETASDDDLIYLRLDFDDENLGTFLSHHFPHLHFGKIKSIRFPSYKSSQTPVLDFFEAIIMQTDLQQWIQWASKTIKNGLAEDVLEAKLLDHADRWERGVFFANPNAGEVRNYFKNLRKWKMTMHPHFSDSINNRISILNYI